jgi:dTDP-4-dehydrorhamnose 3,5-epimerase
MIATQTKLRGAFIIEPERFDDERGFFARAWSRKDFASLGTQIDFIAGNISFNTQRGTLRGMHYQDAPFGQGKLVRCTRGAIFDVGVDIRPESRTFRQWIGVELSETNRLMLYLPPDLAHGYITLEDNTEIYYQVTSDYVPESNRGFRWNDPAFAINWPWEGTPILNDRDCNYPDFSW